MQEGRNWVFGSCRKAGVEHFGTAGTGAFWSCRNGAFRSCRRTKVEILGVAEGWHLGLELQEWSEHFAAAEVENLELRKGRNWAFWSCRNGAFWSCRKAGIERLRAAGQEHLGAAEGQELGIVQLQELSILELQKLRTLRAAKGQKPSAEELQKGRS